MVQAIPAEMVAAAISERPAPRQRSLFPQAILRFDEYAPVDQDDENGTAKRRMRPARRGSRKLQRLEAAGQQRLELESPLALPPRETADGIQSAKYCLETVATPASRLRAAAVDVALIVIGSTIFFALFRYIGGVSIVGTLSAPIVLGALAAIIALYKTLWWLAGGDTPGMSWCGLRLLNFTGHRPTRIQRAQRFAGTCLSLSAAGLGLIWAFGDEEKLCWQDYISKTFPSPKPDSRSSMADTFKSGEAGPTDRRLPDRPRRSSRYR